MTFLTPSLKENSVIRTLTLIGTILALNVAAQNIGPEQNLVAGKHPHCARSADGTLHVVAVNNGAVIYTTVRSDGTVGTPETISEHSGVEAPFICVDKNSVQHVVWGEGNDAYYSNNKGGSWKAKTKLQKYLNFGINKFPHVAGGADGNAYASTWNYKDIKDGHHVLHQIVLDNSGVVTETKLHAIPKQVEEKTPSVAGPTDIVNGDGKVYGVICNHQNVAYSIDTEFSVKNQGVISRRPDPSLWVLSGSQAFTMSNTIGLLAEYRVTRQRTAILVNYKGSGRNGAVFAESSPKWCFPRGAYDAVHHMIYGIYNDNGNLVLGVFDVSAFNMIHSDLTPVNGQITDGKVSGQKGWGAGGIAAKVDGGADFVYSQNNMLKMRSVIADMTPVKQSTLLRPASTGKNYSLQLVGSANATKYSHVPGGSSLFCPTGRALTSSRNLLQNRLIILDRAEY